MEEPQDGEEGRKEPDVSPGKEQEQNAPTPDRKADKKDADNFDPHNKEATQEERATQRITPKALLGSDWQSQETETLVGWGSSTKEEWWWFQTGPGNQH